MGAGQKDAHGAGLTRRSRHNQLTMRWFRAVTCLGAALAALFTGPIGGNDLPASLPVAFLVVATLQGGHLLLDTWLSRVYRRSQQGQPHPAFRYADLRKTSIQTAATVLALVGGLSSGELSPTVRVAAVAFAVAIASALLHEVTFPENYQETFKGPLKLAANILASLSVVALALGLAAIASTLAIEGRLGSTSSITSSAAVSPSTATSQSASTTVPTATTPTASIASTTTAAFATVPSTLPTTPVTP